MKKIFLFLLLASTLFLSGCILFPPQEEQKLIEPEIKEKISLKEIPVNDFLRANIDPLILSNGKKAITLFNKEIYLVDLEAEAIIKSIKLDKPIFSGTDAVLTSDESLLLVPAMDELLLINVNDFSIDSVFPLKGVIVDDVDVIVSKNNSTAFVSTNSVNSSAVTFIDLIGKKKLKELEINGKLQHGNDLVLSKDGKLAVQPTLRGASLIDLENNSLIKEFEFNSLAKPDVDAVFLSDSKTVLIPSRNSLNAIDALTQTMTSIPFKGNLITGVDLQLTQDESLALLPTYEGLQLFDLESKQLLSTIPLTGKIRQNIDLLLIDSKALMPSNKYLHFIDLKTGSISNILSFKEDLMEGVDLLLSEDNKTAFLPLLGRLYEIDVENEKITGSISSLNPLRKDSDLISSNKNKNAVLTAFKSIVLIKNIPENSLLLAKEKSIDVFDLNEKKLIQSFALTQPTLWGSDLVNNSLQSRNSFDEDIALNADELVEYADDSGRRFNSRRPPQTVPPITVPPTANPPGMPPITQPPDFNAPPSYPIPDELNGIFFQKVSGNQIIAFNHDANILFELEFPFSIIQMIFDNQNKKIKTRLSNNSISIIDLSPLPLNPPTQINIPRNVLGASPSEMELFDPNNNLLIEYLSNGDILLIDLDNGSIARRISNKELRGLNVIGMSVDTEDKTLRLQLSNGNIALMNLLNPSGSVIQVDFQGAGNSRGMHVFDSINSLLIEALSNGDIVLINTFTGEIVKRFSGKELGSSVRELALNKETKILKIQLADGRIWFVDLLNFSAGISSQPIEVELSSQPVQELIDPLNSYSIERLADGRIVLLDMHTGQIIKAFEFDPHSPIGMQLNESLKTLIVFLSDGSMQVIDLSQPNRDPLSLNPSPGNPRENGLFDERNNYFIQLLTTNEIIVIDLSTGRIVQRLSFKGSPVAFTFDSENKILAVQLSNGDTELINLRTTPFTRSILSEKEIDEVISPLVKDIPVITPPIIQPPTTPVVSPPATEVQLQCPSLPFYFSEESSIQTDSWESASSFFGAAAFILENNYGSFNNSSDRTALFEKLRNATIGIQGSLSDWQAETSELLEKMNLGSEFNAIDSMLLTGIQIAFSENTGNYSHSFNSSACTLTLNASGFEQLEQSFNSTINVPKQSI